MHFLIFKQNFYPTTALLIFEPDPRHGLGRVDLTLIFLIADRIQLKIEADIFTSWVDFRVGFDSLGSSSG